MLLSFSSTVIVCLSVFQLNQHSNSRFTAPACQDSLWLLDFHHLLDHPVKTKTEQKSAPGEETTGGGEG